MNAGLVGLLRERILHLESKLTKRELETWWEMLREAEKAVSDPKLLGTEEARKTEQKVRKWLGVKL